MNDVRRHSDPIQKPNVVSEMKALTMMESGSRNSRETNVIRTDVDKQLLFAREKRFVMSITHPTHTRTMLTKPTTARSLT